MLSGAYDRFIQLLKSYLLNLKNTELAIILIGQTVREQPSAFNANDIIGMKNKKVYPRHLKNNTNVNK